MQRIQVVHIANIDVGLKIHLGNYMRYQRSQGYDVSATAHPGRWLTHDTTILDGIPVKIIPFEPRLSPLADLQTLTQLVLYFRQKRFDIVHTHSVKPGLLGRLAARIAGVPIIVHTVHGFHFYDGMSSMQCRLYMAIEKLGSACCHSILSQNHQDMETAIRERICPPDKIHYLGNGIDLDQFDPDRISSDKVIALRTELGIPPQRPVIGFVARLVQEKGIYELVQAAGILKSKAIQATFLVIGTSQKGRKTTISPESIVHELGVEEEVMLLGYRDDIPELISLMDVVVLPSYGREGIPRILMESAALGKPVVASQVRGNVEAIEDGTTGLLVPARDGPAVAEAILGLLRDPDRAAEMGKCARQRALIHFDERRFFWRTDQEYRRLLKARLALDPSSILKPVPTT